MTDKEAFAYMREKLYTGVVCDVMDEMGYRNQAMSTRIRPLQEDAVIAGRAKTILAVDIYEVLNEPYKGEIEALDSILEDEVPVVCTNNSQNNGIWGELLSTAAYMRGATGAIIDGLCRDTKMIRKMGFPLFAAGYKPLDSAGRGQVINYDCPVVAGDIRVEPGDVVFADFDGVVIIPRGIFEEVLERAIKKSNMENRTRDDLLKGDLFKDVYARYGVL